LRNAPTALLKDLGYGEQYRYAHNEPQGYAAGVHYWPDDLAAQRFYEPTDRGLEAKIAEKMAYLRQLDKAVRSSKS
jgi:putative ATPase